MSPTTSGIDEAKRRPEETPVNAIQGSTLGPVAVSVIIPCRNEEPVLPHLAATLARAQAAFADVYTLTFIIVDDSSVDGTWEALRALFESNPSFVLLRHARNLGVAAAILTGLRRANTEIVCSIDCDGSYNLHDLRGMIPLLTDDVDLVTASPYHHEGRVRNVAGWRLALSKTASWGYRRILRQKLATYTSCFRVYRRQAAVGLPLRYGGFVGVAEMLGRMDLRGSRIVEYPTTLDVRRVGRSKMKVGRTMVGHIQLWLRLALLRVRSCNALTSSSVTAPFSKGGGKPLRTKESL